MSHEYDERPDLEPVEVKPLREMSIPAVSAVLISRLGAGLFGYAINEDDPEMLKKFMLDQEMPSDETEATMRDLAEVTDILLQKDSEDTVRAAMVGMNPILGDVSPIELFREGERERVLSAAPRLLPD